MDTLLTLVIAVGGIATGIGAIWTAVAARHQAQLTERSLTEHNERLRLNLEVDLLHRMQDRYDSQLFIGRRSAAARYFLDNAFVDDNMVEVERLNDAATEMCDFFESLAYLQSIDALSAKSVWNNFTGDVRLHWAMCKSGIEKMREEWQDPTLLEEFERLSRLMDDMDRERGIPDPTPEQLHRLLEKKPSEAKSHPPPRRREGICRSAASLPNFRESPECELRLIRILGSSAKRSSRKFAKIFSRLSHIGDACNPSYKNIVSITLR